MPSRSTVIGVVIFSALASVASAVTIGQVDTFGTGLAGWTVGELSPNPPQWVPNGGPLGPGDNYMRVEGLGGVGPGSKPNVFNASQWSGDYLAACVGAIELDVRYLGEGPETMHLRIGFEGPDGFAWSLLGVPVGPGTPQPWQENVVFPIDPASLGGDDPTAVLSNVEKLWLYHGPDGQERKTESLDVRVGYDNIRAIPKLVVGDTDHDCDVDFADFNNLANNYTGSLDPGIGDKLWEDGDFDGDEDVDFADFNDLANNYTGALKMASVPEPSSLVLLWLGLLGVLAWSFSRGRVRRHATT